MPKPVKNIEKQDYFSIYRASDMTPEAIAARKLENGGVETMPDPLYTMQASSRNEMIKTLVEAGYSMEGAKISGAILSGCRMEGVSFKNADLSNARLNGVRAANCDFSGAVIDRATFGGADLRMTKFINAKITKTDFDKSTLTGARFGSAEISNCDFYKTHAANIDFRFASLQKVNFDFSSMSRADFRGSRILGSSFREVDLRSHTDRDREVQMAKGVVVASKRPSPDLTFSAVIAGCDYEKAKINEEHPALLLDAKSGRRGDVIRWITSAVLIGAGVGIPLEHLDLAKKAVDLVGYAGASIVAVPLAKISIDAVVDVVKERFSEAQDEAFVKLRRIAETSKLFLNHKKHIVMAFAHPTKSPTLIQALRATQRPGEKFSFFDIVKLRDVHLVFADAKHFKVAFQHLVLRQDAGQTYNEDISVMLADEFEDAPRVMRFLKDGSSVAVWYEKGAPVFSATWDRDGNIVEDLTALPDGIPMPSRQDIFNTFQKAVLSYAPVVPENIEKLGNRHRLDIDQEGNPLVVPIASNVTTIRSAADFVDPSGELNLEADEIVKFPRNRI